MNYKGAPGPLEGCIAWTNVLSLSTRKAIINTIFHLDLTDQEFRSRDDGYTAWFDDWFEEQCQASAGQVSARTHNDLLQIIAKIQSANQNADRSALTLALSSTSPCTTDAIDASVTLAARIWLSLSIDSLNHSVTPGQLIPWNKGQCLSDAIHTTFSPQAQTRERVKLPKVFTAANLEKIAGIQVQWTSNLADHLSLKDDDTKVMLYHQASFLELHRESKCTKLPEDLINETLRTLGLLIPSSDPKSRKWFKKKRKGLHLDSKAGSYGSFTSRRQIDNFHYWRDRLVVLKQTFDDSEPHKLSHWWYDDRKKVQWYTFWIAALVLVLTIVFGLIQSIAGVVQAWASVKALNR